MPRRQGVLKTLRELLREQFPSLSKQQIAVSDLSQVLDLDLALQGVAEEYSLYAGMSAEALKEALQGDFSARNIIRTTRALVRQSSSPVPGLQKRKILIHTLENTSL